MKGNHGQLLVRYGEALVNAEVGQVVAHTKGQVLMRNVVIIGICDTSSTSTCRV